MTRRLFGFGFSVLLLGVLLGYSIPHWETADGSRFRVYQYNLAAPIARVDDDPDEALDGMPDFIIVTGPTKSAPDRCRMLGNEAFVRWYGLRYDGFAIQVYERHAMMLQMR